VGENINSLKFLLDRGGLKFPSQDFCSRMWTIYKYFDCVIGSISQCSHVRDDFVNFLLPKVSRCDDMKCKVSYKKESHHKDAVELAIKKFSS